MSEGMVAALTAFAAAKAEIKAIEKSQKADTGKYSYSFADLADVYAAVNPVLSAHGLVVNNTTKVTDHGIVLFTKLRHVSGETVDESEWVLPVERADAQQVGSLMSYHRRYQTLAILGLQPANEDDDGAKAKGIKHERAPRNVDRETGEVQPPSPTVTVRAALHGLGYNPTQRRQFVHAVIGHHVDNVNDLTPDELGLVLDAVKRVEQGETPSFSPAGCILAWQADTEPFEVNA